MPPNGVVTGSADFGGIEYITIPNTETSAYFAGMYKAYQDSVNFSDDIKRQRASLQTTINTMKDVDAGLGGIGNRYEIENNKKIWKAKDGDGAYDVAYSLAMAGTAPTVAKFNTDLTNMGASFYYFDGNAWQHVTDATPSLYSFNDPGEVGGLKWTNAKGILNQGWTYNGNAVFPYPPSNLSVVEFTPPGQSLAMNFPGTYLHETGTDKYYLVIAAKELQPLSNQNEASLAAAGIVAKDITDSTDLNSLALGTFVKKNGIFYRVAESSPNTMKAVAKPDFVIQDITAESDLSPILPGSIVRMKQGSDEKYYMVSVDHTLIDMPPNDQGNFFATYLKTSQDQAEEWKTAIKGAHDKVASVSQTQSEYLLSLTGSLQASLSLASNLVERFERVYNTLVDHT